MSQLPLFQPPYWTVTELTHYLRDLMESNEILQDLWVQGEVSNLSRPTSGHLYFTIKDSSSALRVVMWRNAVSRLSFIPHDGQAIEVHGSLNIYEVQGVYQLYADAIRPIGEGALFQEFLRLKARLEAEGLFATEHKRPIPPWPRRVGIITSPTGAAFRDILNVLQRRYPLVEVILAPTPVQGDEAPPSIVAALQSLNCLAHPDVILLARGGGSIEDLWAFNDERVARALAASEAPVISGVGHETDFTIADFVSDLRAPTPTAAAELATPDRVDLQVVLANQAQRIRLAFQKNLSIISRDLTNLKDLLSLHSPSARIRSDRQQLDEFTRRVGLTLEHILQIQRTQLSSLVKSLASLNALSVLHRGFALVSHPDGQLVRSIQQVQPDEALGIRLYDGQLEVLVTDIQPQDQEQL